MIRGTCQRCGKPLRDVLGPVVVDRDGRSYHFDCWGRVMDEQRAGDPRSQAGDRPAARRPRRKRGAPARPDRKSRS
jgi:hypothetical protein